MKHRIFRPLALVPLVLLLIVGSSAVLLAADATEPAAGTDADTERTVTGFSDLVAYGTAWVPQQRWRFSLWRPMGWGTEVRSKAAHVGVDRWVHIPLPLITVHDSTSITTTGSASRTFSIRPSGRRAWASAFCSTSPTTPT